LALTGFIFISKFNAWKLSTMPQQLWESCTDLELLFILDLLFNGNCELNNGSFIYACTRSV